MSDSFKTISEDDLVLNQLLTQRFQKKETQKNRNILRTIEGVYKKLHNLSSIADKIEFYKFIEKHPLFKELD